MRCIPLRQFRDHLLDYLGKVCPPMEDIGGAAQDELQDVIRRYGETLHEEFS